jgi:hypothetical protein
MKLINLTPHAITLHVDERDITVPPSGVIARVASTPGKPGVIEVDGVVIPVNGIPTFGEVENLPAPEDGIGFIVSGLVASRASRADVFSPATGPNDGAIRDEAGRIVAVTRLNRSM